jgi:hypothetical protein
MYFIGNVLTDSSQNYFLQSDQSGNPLVVIDDIPNTPSFLAGFRFDISSSGLLSVYIGDIQNNLKVDISNSVMSVCVNDISVSEISIVTPINTLLPLDIKVLNHKLSVAVNDVRYINKIDTSLNAFTNNKFIITSVTNSEHVITVRDIFYEPIVMFNDDIYIARGIYAERYFNINYNEIDNVPWVSSSGNVYFDGGGVGIGTLVPSQKLDVSGNVQAASFIGSGQGFSRLETFTSGTQWTIPPNVYKIKVTLVGGGGGGGGSSTSNSAGAGGGAGAYCVGFYDVTPSQSLTYTIGVAGTGGTSAPGDGGNATSTTTTYNTVSYSAGGGSGGKAGDPTGTGAYGGGGNGGAASGGTLNLSGQNGSNGSDNDSYVHGHGGSSPIGFGYGAYSVPDKNGTTGTGYGAGGAGGKTMTAATGHDGGNGTGGILLIEY